MNDGTKPTARRLMVVRLACQPVAETCTIQAASQIISRERRLDGGTWIAAASAVSKRIKQVQGGISVVTRVEKELSHG